MITSRKTGRWIIPKGWPQKELRCHELAELEAFEEAGLRGRIGKKAVGSFRYIKRMDDGSGVECDVTVFPLQVESRAKVWPEQDERKAIWVEPKAAAKLVDDKGLSTIIRCFKPKL